VGVEDLRVGLEVELVVDVLFSDDDTDHLIWKWRPVEGPAAEGPAGGDGHEGGR